MNGDFTFSAWINPRQVNGRVYAIFSQTNDARFIFINNGRLRVQFNDNSGNWGSFSDNHPATINANVWIAVTTVSMYVNGVEFVSSNIFFWT